MAASSGSGAAPVRLFAGVNGAESRVAEVDVMRGVPSDGAPRWMLSFRWLTSGQTHAGAVEIRQLRAVSRQRSEDYFVYLSEVKETDSARCVRYRLYCHPQLPGLGALFDTVPELEVPRRSVAVSLQRRDPSGPPLSPLCVCSSPSELELRPGGDIYARLSACGDFILLRRKAGKDQHGGIAYASDEASELKELTSRSGERQLSLSLVLFPDLSKPYITGTADGVGPYAASLALVLRRSMCWSCSEMPPLFSVATAPPLPPEAMDVSPQQAVAAVPETPMRAPAGAAKRACPAAADGDGDSEAAGAKRPAVQGPPDHPTPTTTVG